MRFADYLLEHEISDAEFAARIGVRRQSVHRYRSGGRIPVPVVMARIVDATSGAVTANDFLLVPGPVSAERNGCEAGA